MTVMKLPETLSDTTYTFYDAKGQRIDRYIPATTIKAEPFAEYPENYSPEQGEKAGMFVVVHGKVFGNSLSVMEQFLAFTEQNEPSDIKILQYQVLIDSSRDKFGGGDAEQMRIAIADYLTVFSDAGMTYIYLTDSQNVTLEYAQSGSIEYGLAQLIVTYEN